MPAKSKTVKTKAEDTPKESRRRRINLSFLGKINIVYVLFFLLIIASFLIGVLVTQVNYLKNGSLSTLTGSNDSLAGGSLPE